MEIAEFLLDRGADIDARDIDHKSTAAQYLVQSYPEVVRRLIQRGAKTDILMAAAIGDDDLVGKHLDAHPECIRVSDTKTHFIHPFPLNNLQPNAPSSPKSAWYSNDR